MGGVVIAYVGKIIFFIVVLGSDPFELQKVFWTTLAGPSHVLTVVTASVTSGVITEDKRAIPEES